MADADPRPRHVAAQALAEWTRLSADEFRIAYEKCLIPGAGRDWKILVNKGGATVVALACEEAEDGKFLDRLTEHVVARESDRGRPAAEIDQLFNAPGKAGVMQAIFDRHRGLMSAAILLPMLKASYACAVVQVQQGVTETPVGTAFLVKPDMVITAGHVALDVDTDLATGGMTWSHRLKPGLSFRFKARDNAPATERVTVLPRASEPLLASSLPHGATDGSLNLDLNPPADQNLDYALIQLAERIDHVEPLALDPPPNDVIELIEGKACWAFGYSGGDDLKLDVDSITRVADHGARWLHEAQTGEGMSGGCCFNHVGQLVGIHEGSVSWTQDGHKVVNNRGILLKAIRRAQRDPGPDPLEGRVAVPNLEIPDAGLVLDLVRAGRRLADADFAPKWEALARAVFPAADFVTGTGFPASHPRFERSEFRDWIEKQDPAHRLCMVNGPRGAGTSFCAKLLQARLEPSGLGYFEINPTQLAAFSLRETGAGGVSAAPPSTRTSAANFRYNDVTQFTADLRARGSPSRAWHVVIDFGPEDGTDRLLANQWRDFVLGLLGEEWIRVVLLGLSNAEQVELMGLVQTRLPNAVLYETPIELDPIDARALNKYAKELALARGKPLPPAQLQKLVDGLSDTLLGAGQARIAVPAAMQTTFNALLAICLGQSL